MKKILLIVLILMMTVSNSLSATHYIPIDTDIGSVFMPHSKHIELIKCSTCHDFNGKIKAIKSKHELCLSCHVTYNKAFKEELAPFKCERCHGYEV
jgi:hypothetical protein